MLQAIFAKHVKVGDDILLPGGERITVTGVEHRGAKVMLRSSHPIAELSEYDIVGLGHRPYAGDGRREYDEVCRLLGESHERTGDFGGVIRTHKFPALLEALQAYQLGRPEEKAR